MRRKGRNITIKVERRHKTGKDYDKEEDEDKDKGADKTGDKI